MQYRYIVKVSFQLQIYTKFRYTVQGHLSMNKHLFHIHSWRKHINKAIK
jgi:hypothetical protein